MVRAASPRSAKRAATSARGSVSRSGCAPRPVLEGQRPIGVTDPGLEFDDESLGRHGDEPRGFGRRHGPDEREPALGPVRGAQREDRQRTARQEMLRRAPVVGDLVRERRDDARLSIVPADRADPGGLAQPRAGAVGRDEQAGPHSVAAAVDDEACARPREAGDSSRPEGRRRSFRAASSSAARTSSAKTMWAKGSPSSASPSKSRKRWRTASASRPSVTIISTIGCACGTTGAQAPRPSRKRREPAATATARRERRRSTASPGSTTSTRAPGAARRSAVASARPGMPAPATTTSQVSTIVRGSHHDRCCTLR